MNFKSTPPKPPQRTAGKIDRPCVSPISTYDRIHEVKNPFNHCLRLVEYAPKHDIKAAARQFHITLRTATDTVPCGDCSPYAEIRPTIPGMSPRKCRHIESADSFELALLESCKLQSQLFLLNELVKEG